jgi:CVNH domain
MKYVVVSALVLLVATSAFAASGFQNSCSQTMFVYNGNGQPVLQATCLRSNGSANPTSLVITGISNQNGKLTASGGASSFQQSCGNIMIQVVNSSSVNLTALCRASNGSSMQSSIALNNIGNNNGTLTY